MYTQCFAKHSALRIKILFVRVIVYCNGQRHLLQKAEIRSHGFRRKRTKRLCTIVRFCHLEYRLWHNAMLICVVFDLSSSAAVCFCVVRLFVVKLKTKFLFKSFVRTKRVDIFHGLGKWSCQTFVFFLTQVNFIFAIWNICIINWIVIPVCFHRSQILFSLLCSLCIVLINSNDRYISFCFLFRNCRHVWNSHNWWRVLKKFPQQKTTN